jgi:hypothetical protein
VVKEMITEMVVKLMMTAPLTVTVIAMTYDLSILVSCSRENRRDCSRVSLSGYLHREEIRSAAGGG